jgi:serine phosphatase RsbU (regulator of sigma subunit)/DNA-binding LacI/PurR family transcriptional regulator
VWEGIKEAARTSTKKINIIALVGGSLEAPDDQYETRRNILYEIPKMMKLDGIIISGSICSYVSIEKVEKFIAEYGDIPIVSMLKLSSNIPAVTIDNQYGMRELAFHLVDEHKFTKFAFVNGPVNNSEVKDRFSAFKEVLKIRDVKFSKNDVFFGYFDRESGINAVKKIIEKHEGKIYYDVIVCIDDETAMGVLDALKEFGLNVPQDIAVVGFDNTDESKFTFPPMTTVNQPLRKLGGEALKLLLEKLDGKDVPSDIMLKTELVKRNSCKCFFEYDIPKGRIKRALLAPVATKNFLIKEDLYGRVIELFNNSREIGDNDKNLIKQLVFAFCEDVNNQESNIFLKTIQQKFQKDVIKGKNLSKLSQLYRVLWHYSISHMTREAFAFADMLLNRAENLRFDMLNQHEGYKRLKTKSNYLNLYELKELISNAADYEKILNTIAKEFPQIGLDTFFMLRYKSSATSKIVAPKVALAVKNGKRLNIDKNSGNKYEKTMLPNIISKNIEKPFVIVVEPLYFRNETYGALYFILDEKVEYETNIFEALGKQISDSIHTEQIMSHNKKEQEKEHSKFEVVKHELQLGSDIQRSFLPQQIYQPQGFNIEVVYEPAHEVSGDFYDICKLNDDTVAIIVADVSGKDVSSALFMVLTKTLLQILTENSLKSGQSPLDSIYATNDYISKYNQRRNGRFMFVTLFYGILNTKTCVLDYVNAGHNPGLLFSNKGVLREELKSSAPAIGLADTAKFPVGSCVIEKDELLFLYTDGVTDTRNNNNKFYSFKRLLDKLLGKKYETAKDVIKTVDEDLSHFRKSADRFDDITMISLYRTF